MNAKTIAYYVNGSLQKTDEHELEVKTILERAGFTPVSDYVLIRDDGNHKYTDPNQKVELHNGERFTALYQKITPTS